MGLIVCLTVVSDQVAVLALVGRYPTNQLIASEPRIARGYLSPYRPFGRVQYYVSYPLISNDRAGAQGRAKTRITLH